MKGSHARRLALLAAGLALAVVLATRLTWTGSVAAATCSMAPEEVSGVGHLILSSVAASSPDDVWVVGAQYGGPTSGSVAQHWDGASWSDQSPSNRSAELQDVAARSANDAWAVGATGREIVIDHWNGSAWSQRTAPVQGRALEEELLGVSARAHDDAWAVGKYRTGPDYRVLVEHWDGATWHAVAAPSGGTRSAVLKDVVALAPDDVWAVGWHVDGTRYRTLVEHWDGSSWKVVPTPTAEAPDEVLTSVTALGPDDIWAVGHTTEGDRTQPLALRWNGRTWSAVELPIAGPSARLTAIAPAPGGVVVVGQVFGDDRIVAPLVLRWDGSAWTSASVTGAGTAGTFLTGVVAPARGGMVAVGSAVFDTGYDSFVARGC